MTANEPTCFSIVVNTIDRAPQLRTLLRALEHQTYPHFEVIVVVGPTRDNTLEMLKEFAGRVVVAHCKEANLSLSRNIGLQAARGDIVAYIDDDAVPCANWLANLARLFENPLLDGVGGEVWMIYPRASSVQHKLGVVSSLAEHMNVRSSWVDRLTDHATLSTGTQIFPRMMGANMAFRRDVLMQAGGFDAFYVYIAEESDLSVRLDNLGHVNYPVAQLPVYHVPASSRNRTVFTHKSKTWRYEMRSSAYFSIKNGPASGESAKSIALRMSQLLHGRWMMCWDMWRNHAITFPHFMNIMIASAAGVIDGLFHAIMQERRTLHSPSQSR